MSGAFRYLMIGLCLAGPGIAQSISNNPSAAIEQLLQEARVLAGQLPAPGENLDPDIQRAVLLLDERSYLKSLAVLWDIVRRRPDSLQARFVAAYALIQIRRYSAARTLLNQMLELYPQHTGLLNNLAWLYATAEDPVVRNPTQAVALARRALVLAPTEYSIWSTMAEAYYANREYTRALRAAEHALALGREQNAPPARLLTYEEQVTKCRNAVQAFSIID